MSANVVPLHRTSSRLVCSDCGIQASCDCGVSYISAGEYAARAVAKPENADKSDRAIAAEIGVDHKTVGKARKGTGDNSPVEPVKRVGLDGKARSLPVKPTIEPEQPTPVVVSKVGQVVAIWTTMTEEERQECLAAQLAPKAVVTMTRILQNWEAASPNHTAFTKMNYEEKRKFAIDEFPYLPGLSLYERKERKIIVAAVDKALAEAGIVEDLDRIRDTALHEAGHALASCAHGSPIERVQVKYTANSLGYVQPAETRQEAMERSPDFFLEECVIRAAGPMASNPDITTYAEFQAACTDENSVTYSSSDLKQFDEYAHGAVRCHRTENVEAFREEAITATRKLLALPSSQRFLVALTDALVEKRRLNGQAVMAIYREAVAAAEAAD